MVFCEILYIFYTKAGIWFWYNQYLREWLFNSGGGGMRKFWSTQKKKKKPPPTFWF